MSWPFLWWPVVLSFAARGSDKLIVKVHCKPVIRLFIRLAAEEALGFIQRCLTEDPDPNNKSTVDDNNETYWPHSLSHATSET